MPDTLTRPPTTGGGGEPDEFEEMRVRMDADEGVEEAERLATINNGLQDLAPKDVPEPDWEAMESGMEADPSKVGSKAGKIATEQGLVEAGLGSAAEQESPKTQPPVNPGQQ